MKLHTSALCAVAFSVADVHAYPSAFLNLLGDTSSLLSGATGSLLSAPSASVPSPSAVAGVVNFNIADIVAQRMAAGKQTGVYDMPSKRQLAVGFNATQQFVPNTGKYAYVAPGPNDQRGPCPGLNVLANHGYLPHNGVATIDQIIQSNIAVYGMGFDLATWNAVYGSVIDGNLASYSIGGATSNVPSILGLLSQPQGLSGSHNKYECDASPCRGDLYSTGNNINMVMPLWNQLFAMQPNASTANYDLNVMADFRAARMQNSIATNPNYYNGPWTGIVVQPATYMFPYRFWANKSAAYPEGILNQQTLMSFMGVTGTPGKFVWTPGSERIPNNWYTRAFGDEYGIPSFTIDINIAALKYPQFLIPGGNTGKVNTFTPININNLTGGLYSAQTLLQGNNAACFAYQFIQQASPDLLSGLVQSLTGALAAVANITGIANNALGGCPQLQGFDSSQFSPYPGAAGSY